MAIQAGQRLTAANLNPGPWQDLTLLNGWSARSNYYIPGVRLLTGGERVELAGAAEGGTKTTGTIVAQLPALYRPTSIVVVPMPANGSGSGYFEILSTGDIKIVPVGSALTTIFFAGNFPLGRS